MQNTTPTEALRRAIIALEQRQIEDARLFREQFSVTYESLKPVNVLKNIIQDLTSPSELKESLLQTTSTLFAGYVSRKIVVRSSKNPFLRLAGILVEFGVINFVSNHSETIKSVANHFIQNLFGNSDKEKG
jgi:hypothetical protein